MHSDYEGFKIPYYCSKLQSSCAADVYYSNCPHTVNSGKTVKYIIYLLGSFSEPGNILSQLCHQII